MRWCGLYAELKGAAEAMSSPCQTTEPNLGNTPIYESEYRRWLEISRHAGELVDKGILSPMWAAPATRAR